MISKDTIPYLIITIYLLLTAWIGITVSRQQESTPEQYFIADRRIGPIVFFFTLVATNFSAFTFIGFSGAGYRIGISYYPMIAFGTALITLTFYLVGYPAWLLGKKQGLITPTELIENRFNSQSLKWVVLIVMILFTLPYLTVQSIGAGYLLENLTNGQIPYFTGATFLTLTVVLYVFLGGMRSVAHTDVFQGILVFTFMFAAMITIANNLGGFTEANYATYQLKSELFSRQGINIFFTPKRWFSYMLLWMLSVPMFPHIFMRFYISKTAISLKISTILYPIVTVFLFICPVMIGVWGHISFPELSDKASDQILPMMLTKYTSIWLTSGVTVAALAAFMSTLDSQLLALSSLLTRDVYTAYFRPHASFREQTAVGRVMTAILAIIGLIIAYRPPDTIFSIATEAFTGIAVLFPTMITALYSRNVPPQSCIVSIIVGEAALIGFQQGIIPQDFTFGFLPVVPIVLLSTLIILGGSLINPKNNIFNE